MMFPHRADPSSATVTKNRFNGWNQCCNECECVDLPVDQHVKRHENQVFEFTTAVIDNQGGQELQDTGKHLEGDEDEGHAEHVVNPFVVARKEEGDQ